MKTSETLNLAADLIEERGWTGNQPDGPPEIGNEGDFGWDVGDGRPLCLEGGIMAALGTTFDEVDHKWWSTCPAYTAVQAYLDTEHELWWFNDDEGRTAAEVIEVLRAAAVIEAARENAASIDELTGRPDTVADVLAAARVGYEANRAGWL